MSTLDKQISSVEMFVTKRNGKQEPISFDKILRRIKTLCNTKGEKSLRINPTSLCIKIFEQLSDKITTKQIDIFSAEQSASMATQHPDYNILAGRIIISNHQKSTHESFSRTMQLLYDYKNASGAQAPLLANDFITVVRKHAKQYDKMCKYDRDFLIDYFGFKTLEKSYLMRIDGKIMERIQHLWMRVAVALHGDNLERVEESYNLFSQKFMTHATPTLFNAGTPRPQMSSCFLEAMEDDSIDGIFNTVKDCALLSKWAGGIGMHIHNIRAKGSPIYGTNGVSNGIVPMLRVFNNVAKYVDQCLHPDTLIYTTDGTIAIKDCIPGFHKALSADADYHDITKVLIHEYDDNMLNIKLENNTVIRITPEHPIYASFAKGGKLLERDLFEWDKSEKYAENWIPAGELSVGDLVYDTVSECTKIISIETVKYTGPVYDLEVADEHNYIIKNGAIVHNGGGKRNGSIAIYLEPWHGDIEDFLDMRKNHGSEDMKARDLFYALWIPDLFMKRVRNNEKWTLMCPSICKGLADVYGDDFETLYTRYEELGLGRKTIQAQDLWTKIMDAQMETGTPYILFKDHANKKSNQKNVGTIKSSNLCTEIMEVSTPEETAVCNLASIALPSFVTDSNPPTFDYNKLHEVAKTATYNLNRVIDLNFYPIEKTQTSNMKMRPVGLGVQGLADVYFMLKLPFYSEAAKAVNRRIFETIYHASLEQSMELAKIEGPYQCFEGSPASQGILQFDMWRNDSQTALPETEVFSNEEWRILKDNIMQYGLRNSLLVAPMPTASTSQILGFNECFEPITSNIYSRKTIAGNFIVTNRYLTEDLIDINMWNERVKNDIIANNGSIQNIADIPQEIKQRYLTVWEMPMRHLIDMSAERGQYICQSQSLNLWMKEPTYSKLNSMHFYSWGRGLKTGIYYLRRQAVAQAQQFTIEPTANTNITTNATTNASNSFTEPVCETCSA
jgi:ribonucleoside-diphosphate reductase alpha subunit